MGNESYLESVSTNVVSLACLNDIIVFYLVSTSQWGISSTFNIQDVVPYRGSITSTLAVKHLKKN